MGLENNGAFKDFVFDNLIKLVKQEYTPDQFIVETELHEHIARDGRSELLL